MRKWVGGCLLICLVVLGMGVWSAYRKLSPYSDAKGAETMTIAAPVTRVFASLANADSLSTWMADQLGVRVLHHGTLVAGDTLRIGRTGRFTFGAEAMKWAVTDVRPNQLLALQLKSDSSGRLVAQRQFTLTAKGDSTIVTSEVTTPTLDSMRTHRSDTVKASDAMIAGMSRLLISSLRMQSHLELEQLRNHIEGKNATSPVRR